MLHAPQSASLWSRPAAEELTGLKECPDQEPLRVLRLQDQEVSGPAQHGARGQAALKGKLEGWQELQVEKTGEEELWEPWAR